jgi:hypothetical protein
VRRKSYAVPRTQTLWKTLCGMWMPGAATVMEGPYNNPHEATCATCKLIKKYGEEWEDIPAQLSEVIRDYTAKKNQIEADAKYAKWLKKLEETDERIVALTDRLEVQQRIKVKLQIKLQKLENK